MAIKGMYLGWITVSDIKKAQKFFTSTLGLNELNFTPEYGWLEVQGKEGGYSLGIGQANPEHSPAKPGANAVMTFTVDNIEESIKELSAKGVKFVDEIVEVPGHVKMISFADEDNNMFQLVQELGEQDEHSSCC